MVRLRNAGLSREYRRNRRDAGIWLLNFVTSLGQTTRKDAFLQD